MADQFEIFNPKGIVLFRHQTRKVSDNVVNRLISERLISQNLSVENQKGTHTFPGQDYTTKYTFSSSPSLVFALSYPSIVQLGGSETFLENISSLWVKLMGEAIRVNEEQGRDELEGLDEKLEKFQELFLYKLQDLSLSKDEQPEMVAEEEESKNKKVISKKSRRWAADGSVIEGGAEGDLDFSSSVAADSGNATPVQIRSLLGNEEKFGSTKNGQFVVSDLSSEMNNLLKDNQLKSQPFQFLRSYIGGKKVTEKDAKKVSKTLTDHLIQKNVAPEVAAQLVSLVERNLVGSTTQSFTSVESTARSSLRQSLVKLLTPEASVDLLNEIERKKAKGSLPYVISVVGVNGVGKSTNLSKLAFWLLQNKYKVLITACDTFRSGAVEQLRVHVNNLQTLGDNRVGLFEAGYGGADLVSKIAKGAIKHARENGYDIVLMDTAGRRHNDTKLMAPLQSFVKAAQPDKIIMVGEALVGTDSVMQARNFNAAFGAGRCLDFFIISKCDTVGDLIGSMVNMVYATGIPILFVGTGQTYTDLRTLSVDWAVNLLMS